MQAGRSRFRRIADGMIPEDDPHVLLVCEHELAARLEE